MVSQNENTSQIVKEHEEIENSNKIEIVDGKVVHTKTTQKQKKKKDILTATKKIFNTINTKH